MSDQLTESGIIQGYSGHKENCFPEGGDQSRDVPFPFADKESVQCAIVEIEEVRADMNADITEHLADSERVDEGRFWKQRREFEKKWRDPDDVYIDVERREGERKKQGLPPRLGVLPHSAVAEEEKRREAEQERKKTPPKSRGK